MDVSKRDRFHAEFPSPFMFILQMSKQRPREGEELLECALGSYCENSYSNQSHTNLSGLCPSMPPLLLGNEDLSSTAIKYHACLPSYILRPSLQWTDTVFTSLPPCLFPTSSSHTTGESFFRETIPGSQVDECGVKLTASAFTLGALRSSQLV